MEAIKYPFLDLGKVNEPYMDGIREAVERYEGVMEVESGTEFSLNIMLPV